MSRRCEFCSTGFESKHFAKFCSKRCRLQNRYRTIREATRVALPEKNCRTCGAVFVGASYKLYCTNSCRRKVRTRRLAGPQFACKRCEAMFIPKRPDNTQFCSRDCSAAIRLELKMVRRERIRAEREERASIRAKARVVRTAPPPNLCLTCGNVLPKWGKKYCCDDCKPAPVKDPEWTKEYRRQRRAKGLYPRKHIERARQLGLEYEPIHSGTVFERDGWICQLCYSPLNREAKVPHPESPSLDHIIPMSKGGPHTYDNVQAAHFSCNSRKGSRALPSPEIQRDLDRAQEAVIMARLLGQDTDAPFRAFGQALFRAVLEANPNHPNAANIRNKLHDAKAQS